MRSNFEKFAIDACESTVYCGLVDPRMSASDKDLPVLISSCTERAGFSNAGLGATSGSGFRLTFLVFSTGFRI